MSAARGSIVEAAMTDHWFINEFSFVILFSKLIPVKLSVVRLLTNW